MEDTRIRDLLIPVNAVTADLFCTVHRVEEDRIVTLFSSHPSPEELGSWQWLDSGVIGAAVARSTVTNVPDVLDAGSSHQYVAVYPSIRSELAIPIVNANKVVGIINFESTSPAFFHGDRLRTFEVLAIRLANYFQFLSFGNAEELFVPERLLWDPHESDHASILVKEVSDDLLRRLAREPTLLHQLSPRKFEELVARVLSDLGLKVSLTPPIKDGGYDMLAELVTPVGTILTLVECKKYRPDRPVSVEIVRNLYGVLNLKGATHAMIATTSRFTTTARAAQDAIKYRLQLREYEDVASWLRRYA
ncbi:MAG TPA: restriction endonuclease [Acidobacteriaceae bacterium]|nr:restriction endonuclease [Acidobacteriaceae bacterium]